MTVTAKTTSETRMIEDTTERTTEATTRSIMTRGTVTGDLGVGTEDDSDNSSIRVAYP
jgi:hypothetical protein